MKIQPTLVLMTMVAFGVASEQCLSAEQDYQIDFAPILERGFGVANEPSILEQCRVGYGAFRISKHAGTLPIAISRAEELPGGIRVTERKFERRQPPESRNYEMTASEWAELVDLFEKSGFWKYIVDDRFWMSHKLSLWIEGCVDGKFRSISIYPERDLFMTKILDYMGMLEP